MTATQDMIVPSFDDDAVEGRKLAIICSKGNLDMAYPGLILGNAALGEGVSDFKVGDTVGVGTAVREVVELDDHPVAGRRILQSDRVVGGLVIGQ